MTENGLENRVRRTRLSKLVVQRGRESGGEHRSGSADPTTTGTDVSGDFGPPPRSISVLSVLLTSRILYAVHDFLTRSPARTSGRPEALLCLRGLCDLCGGPSLV